jgi:methylmalonyl-CoA mutase C-terminal domain/subunit
MAALEARGIGRLFGPGTSTQDLVDFIRAWFAAHKADEA